MSTFYYVYVMQDIVTNNWYTGCTSDLKKRIQDHKTKKSLYTKHRGPYKLIYFEACLNEKDAYAREHYLKSGMGKKYIKNRIKKYIDEQRMNPVRTQKTSKDIPMSETNTHVQPLSDNEKVKWVLTG